MSKRNFAKVFVASLLAAPMLVMAHGPMGGNPDMGMGAGHGMAGVDRHAGPMQGMAWLRGLDLTQAQKDQVFTLMHGQMPARRAKAQELHKAIGELHQLSAAERFDADKARALSDTVGKLQAERALMRAEMQSKLYAVLTPEQRKKLDERMGSGHAPGTHGRHHGSPHRS